MKAHVKVVELDGTADEITKIIGGLTHPVIDTTQMPPSTPPTTIEGGNAPIPVPIQTPPPSRAEIAKALTNAAIDAAGVEDPSEVMGETLTGGPFESPHDIPPEWRLFNGAGMTCHIRTQPGVAISMCPVPPSKIGGRRIHQTDVPFKNTEVCAACNKALEHARRKDA